jgi:hypothetical protein
MCLIPALPCAAAQLDVYPALPDGQYKSNRYEVRVEQNGRALDSYVYKSENDRNCPPNRRQNMCAANHWTSFSFSGPVQVTVRLIEGDAKKAVVRPKIKGVASVLADKRTIRFTLDKPGNYFVDIDWEGTDDWNRQPLFVFANPPEAVSYPDGVPKGPADGLAYFGPGVHDIGVYTLDKPRMYLAGGAYVRGRVIVPASKERVRIYGRGILSGVNIPHPKDSFGLNKELSATSGQNPAGFEVDGITLTDSASANVVLYGKALVNNVKIMSWESQTDGIAIGADSTISNCFLKSMDDVIHIAENHIEVRDCVVYQEDYGSALQLGWCGARNESGIHVDGLDIVGSVRGHVKKVQQQHYNNSLVALNNMRGTPEGKGIVYSDVLIENVRVEVPMLQLFALQIKGRLTNFASTSGTLSFDQGLGSVRNMRFRNITSDFVPPAKSWFDGNGTDDGSIRGVTFENVRIGGTRLTAENANGFLVRQGKTEDFQYK